MFRTSLLLLVLLPKCCKRKFAVVIKKLLKVIYNADQYPCDNYPDLNMLDFINTETGFCHRLV